MGKLVLLIQGAQIVQSSLRLYVCKMQFTALG